MEYTNWHYEKAGERYAPVPESEIVRMIKCGELGYGDAIWNPTLRDWLPLEASPFATVLQEHTPPPRVIPTTGHIGYENSSGNGLAIASLVLGIVSIIFLLTGLGIIISLITSIVGVCIGYSAKRKANISNRTMANAGYICSVVTLSIIIIVTSLFLFGVMGFMAELFSS